MAIVGRCPGGRPLRRRRETVLISAHRGCEGPRALQASFDHRCHEPMAIVGPFPGGRPLRRRREAVLLAATGGCEGPQPSRPPPIIVATTRWPLLPDSLEGVRSVGAVKRCCWRLPATARDREPSRPPSIIVATNGMCHCRS